MKFSKQWLAQWLALPATNVLVEQLTMAGLEVDAVEPAAPDFEQVVVGEIVDVAQHPDADKLRVCQVRTTSDDMQQVVCGAANARVGIKVPFAQIGAKLPNDFKIKKAKLRGVESFGMLCAAEELGLAEKSDGLLELASDAPVGVDFRDYMQLDDECIEIDLTPNRGDCLSMLGLARETAVLNQTSYQALAIPVQPALVNEAVTVHLDAPQDCPRYASRIIRNVDLTQTSPVWLKEKLRRSGVRSIDAVVDVTNYVLLELGQPMHAFDLNTIDGDVHVRYAKQGEALELLDGQTLTLNNKELVIADDKQALALAGIMGGKSSAVATHTKDILLEAAFFNPTLIAGRARTLGLHTDSSHRFERGVDYNLPVQAIERATALLLGIVGGEAGETVVTESLKDVPAERDVILRSGQIQRVLGLQLQDEHVERILTGLGFTLSVDNDGWQVSVPSWRFDISLEADLLEELARVYGYDQLPSQTLPIYADFTALDESIREVRDVHQILLQRAYQEVISYSFIAAKLQQQINPEIVPVAVKNPISQDMAVMRTSLLPGLLQTLDYNVKRQQNRVRIFEQGLCFIPQADGELKQVKRIAGLIYGQRLPEQWAQSAEMIDFYDVKADVQALLPSRFETAFSTDGVEQITALHPGQSAIIRCKEGKKCGYLGILHPQLQQAWGFSSSVAVFELAYSFVEDIDLPKFSSVSKYPEVRRDLSLLIDEGVQVGDILTSAKKYAGDLLKDLILFDSYQGDSIDNRGKSIALGLIFGRADTTLTDEEVNQAVQQITAKLEEEYNAKLR